MKNHDVDLEKAIVRAARRLFRDVSYEGEDVGAFTDCAVCGKTYNLYNPMLAEDAEDCELCAICTILDLVEIYEVSAGAISLN